jgi:hypothetical protein
MYSVNLKEIMLDIILYIICNSNIPQYSLYVQKSDYKSEVKLFFLEKMHHIFLLSLINIF